MAHTPSWTAFGPQAWEFAVLAQSAISKLTVAVEVEGEEVAVELAVKEDDDSPRQVTNPDSKGGGGSSDPIELD
ncbi:hypothetical protein T492DRAFT_856649 [Pavlovales sp. CCMP2436]|nr:hypothetical protein T492DRAFT_856649 [Pavlovales sp. CCMP2436]